MNRSSFALLVALLVHLLIFLLLWILGTVTPQFPEPKKEEKRIKISLKELPKKYKKSGVNKQKPQPHTIAPPMPKGKQLKKILKSKMTKQIKKSLPKKPRKQKRAVKRAVKRERKPLLQKKHYTSLVKKTKRDINRTKVKKQDPMAWMFEDKSKKLQKVTKIDTPSASSINNDIKELYGEEFGKLTAGQQKYILDNQEIMRRITQQILTRVARVNLPNDLNINRSNVVEFYLHPNGDMTDFRFLSKSGYYVLDDTTKETIEYAYSRYPRPKEKTLIRYNVYYNLAR